jgi:hypothetical protein
MGTPTTYIHNVSGLTKGFIYYCLSATNSQGTTALSAELKAETQMASDAKVPKAPIIAAQGTTANDYMSDSILIKATQGAFVHNDVYDEKILIEISNTSSDGPFTEAYRSAQNVRNVANSPKKFSNQTSG